MAEEQGRGGWMFWCLAAAGIYNVLFGAWAVMWPGAFFQWIGAPPANYPQLWQCIGMIVGVYGVGYLIAARSPMVHWPIVLVGLLGKVLGPIGFLLAYGEGKLPLAFGAINLTNDLVWWVPFGVILWRAREFHRRAK